MILDLSPILIDRTLMSVEHYRISLLNNSVPTFIRCYVMGFCDCHVAYKCRKKLDTIVSHEANSSSKYIWFLSKNLKRKKKKNYTWFKIYLWRDL